MIKKDIIPTNDKNQKHGLWILYKKDDTLKLKGQFINDIDIGHWIENWSHGYQVKFYIR